VHHGTLAPDPDWLTRPGVLRGLAAVARHAGCYAVSAVFL